MLTVLVGPVVPVPLPREAMESLTGVSVTVPTDGPAVFSLSFEVSTQSSVNSMFLLAAAGMPMTIRVIIVMTINGMPNVLIDGVMTEHSMSPNESGTTSLQIMGEDLQRLMDYIPFDGLPYPAMPPEARVAIILSKYALYGVLPKIIPSIYVDVPLPTDWIPIHEGTDLAYLRAMAEEVGYTFYMEPGPVPGVSFGYWGPLVKVGVPQPALNINMDAQTNVQSLNFSINTEAKATPIVNIQVPFTGLTLPIPVPDLNPLAPPLGIVPLISKRTKNLDIANYSAPRALMRAFAEGAKTAGGVRATGTLDVIRYGRPLKSRALVGVRGAGVAYDGLYYVESVTHSIKHGEYTQSFELNRGGLVSSTPRVPA